MCWLVTLVVRPQSIATVERFSSALKPHRHVGLQAHFGDGNRLFAWDDRGCSCSIVQAFDGGHLGDDEVKLRRKYEKKGWSASKIERALNNRTRGSATKVSARLPEFTALLSEVVASGPVKMFAHWYSGSFDDEAVAFVAEESRQVDELVGFPADTVIALIHRSAQDC